MATKKKRTAPPLRRSPKPGGDRIDQRPRVRRSIRRLIEIAATAEQAPDALPDVYVDLLVKVAGLVERARAKADDESKRPRMCRLIDPLTAIYRDVGTPKLSAKQYADRTHLLFISRGFALTEDGREQVLIGREKITQLGGPVSAAKSVVGKVFGSSKRTVEKYSTLAVRPHWITPAEETVEAFLRDVFAATGRARIDPVNRWFGEVRGEWIWPGTLHEVDADEGMPWIDPRDLEWPRGEIEGFEIVGPAVLHPKKFEPALRRK